jgi:hypothetical protein
MKFNDELIYAIWTFAVSIRQAVLISMMPYIIERNLKATLSKWVFTLQTFRTLFDLALLSIKKLPTGMSQLHHMAQNSQTQFF